MNPNPYQQAYFNFITSHAAPKFPTVDQPAVLNLLESPHFTAAIEKYQTQYNAVKGALDNYKSPTTPEGQMKSLADYLKDLNSLDAAVTAALNGTRGQTSNSFVTLVNNLNKRAATIKKSLNQSIKAVGAANIFTFPEQSFREGGTVYSNVADLRLYLQKGMQPSLGLFAEAILVSLLTPLKNAPPPKGQPLVELAAKKAIRDSLRSSRKIVNNNISIEPRFVDGKDTNKTLRFTSGGSGLVDIRLSLSGDNSEIRGQAHLNISVKQYDDPLTSQFKAADHQLQRALQALAHNPASALPNAPKGKQTTETYLFYALNRALSTPKYADDDVFMNAFRNAIIPTAIFGDGDSAIDLFILQGQMHNAAAIARDLESNPALSSLKINSFTLSSKDRYKRNNVTDSTRYYTPYETVRNIAAARYQVLFGVMSSS